MKKTLTILATVVALSLANATSFVWQATGVAFDGTKVKNSTNLNGYLIYLGNSTTIADSYSWEEVDTMIADAKSTKNGASTLSKIQSNSPLIPDGSANGDTYAMLITWQDGTDLYYALSSTTYTVSGVSLGIETLENFDATAGFNGYATDKTGAEALTTGAGWQKAKPIPEPATGALALAGLALLIRRRRV